MENLISIDIGQHTTKVLEAVLNKEFMKVIAIENFKTPIKDNQIVEQDFFEQLDRCIPISKIKLSSVAVSVPSAVINFTTLNLVKIPDKELRQVAIREAKRKILPRPANDDIFDYIVTAEEKLKGLIQSRILVGAGSRVIIEKYLELFKSRDICVDVISSTPLALSMYFYKSGFSMDENWVFVDIGFKNTSMVMFDKRHISLIRNISFGCFDFIDEIVKRKNIEFKLAQEALFSDGIEEEIVSESWKYLLSELRRSFAYFKEITAGQRFDSMLLSGGMFQAKRPFEILKRNLGGNLKVFNLIGDKYIDTKTFPCDIISSQSHFFATAIGLALSLKAEKQQIINFVPREMIQQKKVKRIKLISFELLIGLGIILLVINITLGLKQQVIKMILSDLNKKYSDKKYQEVIKEHNGIKTKLSSLTKHKDLVEKLSKKGIPFEKLFMVLSQALPERIFIKDISVSFLSKDDLITGVITAGIVADYEAASREINRFYNELKKSAFFLDISLDSFSLDEVFIKAGVEEKGIGQEKEREYKINIKARQI